MTVESVHVRLVVLGFAIGLVLSARATAAGAAEGAAPTDAEEARAYHEKAKAAFALSHYAQAAEFFEKAFELKSDPALLYNAAQSHRLAGNKQRALTLYQNYLRVYGRDERRAQIDQRIEELKRAIEHDRTEVPVPPPAGWPPGSPGAPKAQGAATTGARAAEPARPLPTQALPAPALRPAPPANVLTAPVATPPAPPPPVALPTPPPAIEPLPASSGSTSPTLLTQSSTPSNTDDRSLTQKPWFWIAIGGGVAAAATVVLLLTLGGSKDPTASFGRIPGN
jgi:hypothetical protein